MCMCEPVRTVLVHNLKKINTTPLSLFFLLLLLRHRRPHHLPLATLDKSGVLFVAGVFNP